MEGEIITKEKQPDIYKWLNENVMNYKEDQNQYTLTSEGKINAYCSVYLKEPITQIKYPFGYVGCDFGCGDCYNLTSLIGVPSQIGGYFSYRGCESLTSLIGFPKKIESFIFFGDNKISNNPKSKEKYNLYVDMWFELLESVSENEKWEYINNYKNKLDYRNKHPIIPKEIINKYKIDFLLNDK